MAMDADSPELRIPDLARAWDVDIERIEATAGSVVAFGHRNEQLVVLKVVRFPGDEWLSGRMLEAFAGRGVVRMLAHADGAVLLERLVPGTALADEAIPDDDATAIIAAVIGRMSPGTVPSNAPTVESWGQGFERHTAGGSPDIPSLLVEEAHRIYIGLCASQTDTRLLHGDLHHENVLLDARRGWLAIDPKGVVGELAYEVGAALRNPCRKPELFAAPTTIRRRVDRFARELSLDGDRILEWAFAQAVLAAIWEIEDHGVLKSGAGWIALANAIWPMLSVGAASSSPPRS